MSVRRLPVTATLLAIAIVCAAGAAEALLLAEAEPAAAQLAGGDLARFVDQPVAISAARRTSRQHRMRALDSEQDHVLRLAVASAYRTPLVGPRDASLEREVAF